MLCTCQLAEFVQILLAGLFLVYYDSVIQVTSLDESCCEQWLNLPDKDKCSCSCNLRGKVIHIVKGGKLTAKEFSVKGYHAGDREFLVWKERDTGTCILVLEFHLLGNVVEVLLGILLNCSYT